MSVEYQYKSIKNWVHDDRPREKLVKFGPENLSNSELLAILIGSGTKGFSAVDAGRQLLELGGSISKVAKFNIEQIQQVKGLGPAKSITLRAAFELAKRIKAEPFKESITITSPEKIANLYIPRFYGEDQEMFYIILLSTSKKIIKERMISKGTLDSTIVHPRDVFKYAIENSASCIMLMHNHPSGNCSPSRADIEITKQLIDAGNMLEIPVLDHIIIAGDTFTSLRNEGIVSFG